ncbi:MAG TPA: pitrilysin family protein [Pseudogracilibacillus sp.]|nr:pitrilysin family protein [Pseudogracilibacillus sp.]
MKKVRLDTVQETLYKERLPNGLDVFILPKENVSKVYGIFMTDYGSIDRTFIPIGKEEEVTVPDGVAHFLEHKLFEKEDYDVLFEFSKLGASPNAFTSSTKTAYLFSATDHIEKNISLLLDYVQEPYFSDESVEKEKGIIVQELKMYQDNPGMTLYSETLKSMFKEHPIHIDILGTEASINAITKEDLYTCYESFYHPANMALFIIGNIDPEETGQLIRQNQAAKTFPEAEKVTKGSYNEQAAVFKKEKTVHMPVSVPKVAIGIKDSKDDLSGQEAVQREVMQSILLNYLFSKSGLYYESLYDEGVIDDSFGYHTSMEKSYGYTMISSETDEPRVFAERIKDILLSIKDLTLEAGAFQRMKNKQIGFGLRAMNSLEYIAREYVDLHFRNVDYFELQKMIEKITLEEAQEYIESWITEDKLTVCIVEAE